MIEKNQYIEMIENYFSFLKEEFNYELFKQKLNGNFYYDIQYRKKGQVISVSYENIENYFQVIIYMLSNGKMPHYDDKINTLRLNQLNQKVYAGVDNKNVVLNNEYFSVYQAGNDFERKVLKSAKDLRLCLIYLDKLNL